jgi:polyphosphate glucokinase
MKILGIDVGGTGIKGALVNLETGELLTDRLRIPTPQPATPEAVTAVIKQITDHFNWKNQVGVGFPTPLLHGKCITGGNLDKNWKNVQVNELLKKGIGNEFFVVNDADAAGLAEMNFGAGKNKEGVVIVITIGTGIGSAVFLDGKLLPNTELGHVLYKNGKIFEKYAADSARRKKALNNKEWSKRLEKYFKHINLILSPDLFIIGGGASKRVDKFNKFIKIPVPLIAAEAENNAGIIGAAMAAKTKIK